MTDATIGLVFLASLVLLLGYVQRYVQPLTRSGRIFQVIDLILLCCTDMLACLIVLLLLVHPEAVQRGFCALENLAGGR